MSRSAAMVVGSLVACALWGCDAGEDRAESVAWHQDFEAGSYAAAMASQSGWDYALVQPNATEARLDVDATRAASGRYALHAVVPDRASDAVSSKAMIGVKRGPDGAFSFPRGTAVSVRAWFWIAPPSANAYLVDIEDSTTGNVGVRLYLDPDGRLVLNRDKIGLRPHLIGDAEGARLPFEQWAEVRLDLTVGDGSEGRVRVSVDGEVSVEASVGTIVREVRAYDTVQLGYTVSQAAGELWMDDATIEAGLPE